MSQEGNCLSIVGSEILTGIPSDTPWGRSFEHTPQELVGETVRWATRRGRTTFALTEPPTDPTSYCFVYFAVPKLYFGTGAYLSGLNLWPGGEWYDHRPVWRRCDHSVDSKVRRKAFDREELWALPGNEPSLFLIDSTGAVRILKRCSDEFELATVSPEDLGAYICARGETLATHSGITWALRNLECLAQGHPDIDFSRSLARVRSRLAKL